MSKILCLAVAFAAVTGAASATTITATFTGTIYSGYDLTGLFGPADSSLDGQTFTANFIFDPTVPGATRDTQPNYDRLLGSGDYGVTNPLVAATVTINGVSKGVAGKSLSDLYVGNNNYFYAQAADIYGGVSLLEEIFVYFLAFGLPDSLDTDFTLSAADFASSGGDFYFSPEDGNGNVLLYSTWGRYSLDSATYVAGGNIVEPPSVPLPASLPLMASALAGAALLRRRRAA